MLAIWFSRLKSLGSAEQPPAPDAYPMLNLLVRHGRQGALVVTLGALVAGIAGAMALDAPWLIPIVVVADALLFILARSYVELVRVIADMLLPK